MPLVKHLPIKDDNPNGFDYVMKVLFFGFILFLMLLLGTLFIK